MLNGERIRQMGDAELADFLGKFVKECKYPYYADINSWITSEDAEMKYKGKDVRFRGRPAKKVDERVILGKLYDVLIQDGEVIKAPQI